MHKITLISLYGKCYGFQLVFIDVMINISSPTSRCRNRNCLFKFDKSIVSISITSISPKPNNARFFKISQPSPPAPITKIRHCCCRTKNIDSGHENQCKVFEKSYCRQFVVQARNLDVPKTMFDSDMFSVYRNAFLRNQNFHTKWNFTSNSSDIHNMKNFAEKNIWFD